MIFFFKLLPLSIKNSCSVLGIKFSLLHYHHMRMMIAKLQYRELRFQVGSTSTIRVLKIPLHSWLATKFQKLPSVLLLERSWHIQEDVIIRFIFPSMVVKRNTISQFLMNKFMIIYGYFLHLLRHCRSN